MKWRSGKKMEDRREPLLELGFEAKQWRWWKRGLDMEEAKLQLLFSLPLILTNVFYYMISLVSVMFAGHLGELELAAATLASTLASVTGFAFMVPLSLFLSDFVIWWNGSFSSLIYADKRWKIGRNWKKLSLQRLETHLSSSSLIIGIQCFFSIKIRMKMVVLCQKMEGNCLFLLRQWINIWLCKNSCQ